MKQFKIKNKLSGFLGKHFQEFDVDRYYSDPKDFHLHKNFLDLSKERDKNLLAIKMQQDKSRMLKRVSLSL